jgi:hypothetical protein
MFNKRIVREYPCHSRAIFYFYFTAKSILLSIFVIVFDVSNVGKRKNKIGITPKIA